MYLVTFMRLLTQAACSPISVHISCIPFYFTWKPVYGLRTFFLLTDVFLGVFPHRFEQQGSISLFHQETQLPERGVVSCAAAFQSGNQFLVLRVVLQEVPDGEDCPLADD